MNCKTGSCSPHCNLFVFDSECTQDSCSPASGDAQSSFLTEFVRTFTWDLKAPEKTVLGLDIIGEGLKEMSEPTSCPDGYQYTVTRAKPKGGVQTQAYCRGGSVTHLDLPNQVTMSLQVKPKAAVDVVFTVTAKPLSMDIFKLHYVVLYLYWGIH